MKRTISLILSLLMLLTVSSVLFVGVFAEESKTVISYLSPAITANTGETIDLESYSYLLKDETVLTDLEWSLDGEEKEQLKFDEKGVYPLSAKKDGKSYKIYAVIKEPADKEYVLYENAFDSDDSTKELKKTGNGDMSVKDGKMVLNTTGKENTIVLLPEWLGDFGNYTVETSAAMMSSTDSSRWFSLVYRYNSGVYSHMCVRKNMSAAGGEKISGGIECVSYSGGWKYLRSASYDNPMSYGTFYTFKATLFGGAIQYSVDDNVVIHIDNSDSYYKGLIKTGRVGLQGNSNVMNFDYIKITLPTQAPAKPVEPVAFDPLVNVEHQQTNILNSVTNIAFIDESQLDAVLNSEIKPNSVLVSFKEAITQEAVGELYNKCLEKGVIPGVVISSSDDGNAVSDWCNKNKLWDINIASEKSNILSNIRTRRPTLRTMLIINDVGESTPQQLRETARKFAINALILPSAQSTKELVSGLQELHVTVWCLDKEVSKTSAAWMISSGAHGIASNDYTVVDNVMKEVYGENTLTKTPSVIGHRGNPSVAPENSISGYLTAIENGATEVETDIYLTKDRKIVIMHDDTLARTTNYKGTKKVTQMTLEEIKEYYLLDKSGKVSEEKVPTLEEMFIALKDTSVYIVVELKSGDSAMIRPLYDLINQYGMASRINIISFSGDILKATFDQEKTISAGLLSGSLTQSPNNLPKFHENTFNLIKNAQLYNASVNISHGNVCKEFYTLLNDRGISLFPWTYGTNTVPFYNAFLWGVDGLTTDYAQYTKNTVMDFDIDKAGVHSIKAGEVLKITSKTTTYGGKAEDVTPGIVWIENSCDATFDVQTGEFKSANNGTASFMLNYEAKLPNGKKYVLYSQPVTVNVETVAEESSEPSTDISTDGISSSTSSTDTSEADDSSDGTVTVIICVVAAIAVITAAVVVKKRKK